MSKKIPMRTCLGCQTVRPKKEMIRIVRTPDGQIQVDCTGKKAGRGGYVCPNEACIDEMVKKKRLSKTFGVEPPPSVIEELKRYVIGETFENLE
ncbi:MAG TPA: YlxR family protein [Bacillota bacterium]|nr:YlxR family protein [Bacillota bacterium]HOK64435.1 YlxR family protein [Bacillota bacterium]HOL11721.1 YlxR family protein [Bacillota bacterium]HOQ02365.1 YlxR family protein [Bacillota bacterium]HPP60770.1 YlxR family protein [Bacillota bacterium]